MIQLSDKPVIVQGNTLMEQEEAAARGIDCAAARQNTLAWNILAAHNTAAGDDPTLRLRFDALASHDITYVGIIQTARASGLERFPMPYALTNCHNSLCAVGGTINEDDHLFGLTAARKYGGIFVPPHLAVIHQYAREMMAGCGKMILGSDSHTRYGALGTMAVGEGGPELVKQLLGKTYDVARPEVVLVWLENAPRPGVGPQDIAIALIGAVFKNGFVKNRVMEFAGPGVAGLSVEYRCGIDVMTTETTCLSSIWTTDDKVRDYLAMHGRADDYTELRHDKPACFDRCIRVDLSAIEPMMALPFHPSNAYPVAEVVRHADELFAAVEEEARKQFGKAGEGLKLRDKIHDGGVWVDQGIIAGCAGGSFENCCMAASILDGRSTGCGEFSLSVYPASEPQAIALVRNGAAAKLMAAGAVIKNAFCGPCFGAGDTPAHGALSIRHSTRNFPNREGSKPGNGQISAVALMDARSIAGHGTGLGQAGRGHYLHFRCGHLPAPRLQRFRQGRCRRGTQARSQHRRLAVHEPPAGEPGAAAGFGHHRPRDHHRRAHPLGRDLVPAFQPAQAFRVHPVAQGPRLCGPRQGRAGHGKGPSGRSCRCRPAGEAGRHAGPPQGRAA